MACPQLVVLYEKTHPPYILWPRNRFGTQEQSLYKLFLWFSLKKLNWIHLFFWGGGGDGLGGGLTKGTKEPKRNFSVSSKGKRDPRPDKA